MGKKFFMDLYAYLQIEDYDALAKANGIEIPRLRGYRWMENEKCLSEEDIENCLNEARARAYEHVLTADPPFSINPEYYILSYTTDQRKKKYLIQEEQTRVYYPPDNPEGKSYTTTVIKGLRWDLLHGKRRKAVKYYLKKELRYEKHQLAVWNKYAGQKNVLYIHARLGTSNWSNTTWEDFRKSSWFLDGCDDASDRSYCDIYAKIDPESI